MPESESSPVQRAWECDKLSHPQVRGAILLMRGINANKLFADCRHASDYPQLTQALEIKSGAHQKWHDRNNANEKIILLYYTHLDISSGHGIKGRSPTPSFAACAAAMPLLA